VPRALNIHRSAQEVALHSIASPSLEEIASFFILDTLGHSLDLQPVSEFDDRFNDTCICVIRLNAPNESSIDLYLSNSRVL
jgi:hypothetical protein